MANSKNNIKNQAKESEVKYPQTFKAHVKGFAGATKPELAGLNIVYFTKETLVRGIKYSELGYRPIPDFVYLTPFINRDCEITLDKGDDGLVMIANISLVETEEEGGLVI